MNKRKSKDWYNKIKSLKYFAAIFLPLLIVLVSALFTVNNWEIKKDKQILMERENTLGKMNKVNIQTILSSVTSDLEVVKGSAILTNYVNNPTMQTLIELNKMFMRFSKNKTVYDQIRFINIKGMELARVNYNEGNVYITSDKQLQNKKTK